MVTLKKTGLLIIFFMLMLSSSFVYCQDFDKIKNADTVYIYFKNIHYKQIFLPQKNGFGDYYFYFDKFYEFKQINFYHTPLTPEERKEKKSFLKKNKDLIIDYDFLTNMYNYEKAKELLLNKKKIYLIDKKDFGWFSIKLIEVKVSDFKLETE